MTLYGPLTAQNFLQLLKRIAGSRPDRAFFEQVLDALIETLEAERGFLLRVDREGGLRVLAARNHDRQPISRPLECVNHHAVRRALASPQKLHHAESAHLDRRYRTEEVQRGGRRPRSILVLGAGEEGESGPPPALIYFDHRFQKLEFSEHQLMQIEHWLALLGLALRLRERERQLRRRERALLLRGFTEAPRAVEGPAPSEPEDERLPEPIEFHGLWTRSPAMAAVLETVNRLSASVIPVVIAGETGAGKGLLAQALHRASLRAPGPFVAVNCGALPDALLESELFGHARGAFTGAEADHEGLLLQAAGGTLFLDEIGDMSREMQKKLLRFLENGRFRPLGGKKELESDVRIISATRLDLQREVARGRFRSDLYYRLCGIRLRVPPLRERRADIAGLAELFLDRFSRELGIAAPVLEERARSRLTRYPWPGNARELENAMRQAAAMGFTAIGEAQVDGLLRRGGGRPPEAGGGAVSIDQAVAGAERRAIQEALRRCSGNKSRAAGLLGITRKSLYRRLMKYGLLEQGGGEERADRMRDEES